MAYIELSRENYFHNLQLLSDKLGSKEKLAVVLKDNAYGHGLVEMATLASEFGVQKAVVRTHEEASKIATFFPFILILVPDWDVESGDFSLVINTLADLERVQEGAKIHLKVDSGMHRNGIMPEELETAFIMIEERGLLLEGVMTHFRSADELSTELFWQQKSWEYIKKLSQSLAQKHDFDIPLFHAANSATVLRLEHYHDSFARCGIATYGYEEFHPSFQKPLLKPVMRLWAEKIATRLLKKGQCVGYGGVGEMQDDGHVSTYDIGYGDGYFRYQGDGDLTTEEGYKILGRVSMDNISIEGKSEKVALISDAKALARYHDTISYEVLTRISHTLKRIVL